MKKITCLKKKGWHLYSNFLKKKSAFSATDLYWDMRIISPLSCCASLDFKKSLFYSMTSWYSVTINFNFFQLSLKLGNICLILSRSKYICNKWQKISFYSIAACFVKILKANPFFSKLVRLIAELVLQNAKFQGIFLALSWASALSQNIAFINFLIAHWYWL